jgi:hypothetical protein
MRRAEPDSDTEHFNSAITLFKRAEKEILDVHKEYERGRNKIREEINELLALIESIPEG